MKQVARKTIACAVVLSGACALSDNACASGPYVLQHSVIAGGGGPSSGGVYQITATFGQSSIAVRAGGQYVVFERLSRRCGAISSRRRCRRGFESF